MTKVEFQWKVQNSCKEAAVFVVGDSRVGWGFAEGTFNKELAILGNTRWRGYNMGLAGTAIEGIVKYLLASHKGQEAGTLVVNFSPGGAYTFSGAAVTGLPESVSLQEFADERIKTFLQQEIYSFQKKPNALIKPLMNPSTEPKPREIDWYGRNVYLDGFITGTLGSTDGSVIDARAYQLDYYRQIIPLIPTLPATCARRAGVLDALRGALRLGWKVVLIRMPVAAEMRCLENTLPAVLRPEAYAESLSIPFIDYGVEMESTALQTQDGSHLTADSARDFGRLLARDLVRLGCLPGN
jgi:hypothetical protein